MTTAAGTLRLATAHAPLVVVEPDWRSRFLSIVADPNVALILLTIGIYGLFFEFANPGFVLPGVAGTICLLVGLFAMQLLPVSYGGPRARAARSRLPRRRSVSSCRPSGVLASAASSRS
ncbi:hypothetical protein L0Z26_24155 [Burkholderia multivorans]|nr:hypothetical protein [Burkholderia multivorans]MCO1344962.1 hypothetical protein [Burkholderia multivorans]